VILSSVLLVFLLRADPQLSPLEHLGADSTEFRPYVAVGTGLQYNVPLSLVIRQSGQPDLRLTARFSTRPFFEVPYYDVKVGIARKPWAFELELVHHKLYLDNPPEEVGAFELTHGYNPLLVNVARDQRGVTFRAGVGILIAHPETTIRGRRFPEDGGILGWYICGPAGQVSVSKSFDISHRLYAGLEGKAVGAWARVPVVNGSADVPNLSVHGLASVGWRF
jgi:hypothetical protein